MSWINALVVGAVTLAVSGCDSGCDRDLVERAEAFIDAHQSCQTNEDCVVVSDVCAEIPGGYCGQLAMNSEGAASAEWRGLERDLSDCAPSSCEVCDAALVPTCTAGSCRGR